MSEQQCLLVVGSACWLAGLVLMFAGLGNWAWLPINGAGLAFGYRHALFRAPHGR